MATPPTGRRSKPPLALHLFCLAAVWPVAGAAAILEGYPTETSVILGDTLDLHVRSQSPEVRVEVWRQGQALEYVADSGAYPGHDFAVPDSSWERGCNWPVTARVAVSDLWKPGAYLARLRTDVNSAWIPFVVRARVPGSTGRILVMLSTNTWQAYNRYGGKSLYASQIPTNPGRAYRVSTHRPYNYFAADGSGNFFLWDAPFISWLESLGYAYEVCTSVDLHRRPGLLDAYDVFTSVGHDEYWSKEQYDEVERFVDAGGSLAFFSANTLWWQVRYEDSEHTLVCYKSSALDPFTGVDNSRVTVNWHAWPVLRPPVRLMGVYYNGSSGITPGPYAVGDPGHWAYRGVTVASGQTFGAPMVAYEIDGRAAGGPPVLDVIAHTERPDVQDGGVMRPADAVYYERTPAYGWPAGSGGRVFACGTVNWVQGLVDYTNGWTQTQGHPDPVARAITVNVLDRLGCAVRPPTLLGPADGSDVVAGDLLLRWAPGRAHRPGIAMTQTVYWQPTGMPVDSLVTADSAVWIAIDRTTTYRWWVRAAIECGSVASSPTWSFRAHAPTDAAGSHRWPLLVVLPEGDHVSLLVTPAEPITGTIRIYDVSGRLLRTFGPRRFAAGRTHTDWDLRAANGARVAAGVYFVRFTAGTRTAQCKFLVAG
jgi:N,N-dimethylformamidase beta subunit-like protein